MSASIHYLRPYCEAFLDDIPLLWVMPEDTPTAIVIHVPDLGQRKEDAFKMLELHAREGQVAVSLDLHHHGARRDARAEGLGGDIRSDYARVLWTLLGETVLDLPTIATWARTRFGNLPLSLSGHGLGADAVLAAARMISGVSSVTCVGASPDWAVPLDGFDEVTGKPDTRASVFRDMLEPARHTADYTHLAIHFLKTSDDSRAGAIDAFKSAILAQSTGQGGEIVTTTLTPREGVDFSDPNVWWPHMSRPAA